MIKNKNFPSCNSYFAEEEIPVIDDDLPDGESIITLLGSQAGFKCETLAQFIKKVNPIFQVIRIKYLNDSYYIFCYPNLNYGKYTIIYSSMGEVSYLICDTKNNSFEYGFLSQ